MSLSKLQEIVKDKPGMLQSMGSQRVRHGLVTELQQNPLKSTFKPPITLKKKNPIASMI